MASESEIMQRLERSLRRRIPAALRQAGERFTGRVEVSLTVHMGQGGIQSIETAVTTRCRE